MRIAFTSDLHTDHHPELVELIAARAAGADVLIVAGDVSPSMENVFGVLSRLRKAVPAVLFVPGNHDLWSVPGTPDSRQRYLELFPAICASAGVMYLPAGPVTIDDVTFAGQTGWYDYSLRDPALDGAVPLDAYAKGSLGPLSWSDKQFVIWPGMDDRTLTAFMAERLARDLVEAGASGRPVWVVTHMLPFVELVVRRPLPWGFVNGFLGATALGAAIVGAARAGVPVAHAICGHTHFRQTAEIDAGTYRFTAETSPIGYPREVVRQAPSLAAHVGERVRIVDVGDVEPSRGGEVLQ